MTDPWGLINILGARRRVTREGDGLTVYVPGAQVQVSGYETPLALTLRESVAKGSDVGLAVRLMADNLARVVAKGVYARYASEQDEQASAADAEEGPATIHF